MTISNNYVPLKQLGNGSTTQFSSNWAVLSAAYILVYLESVSTRIQTLQVLGSDYTLVFTGSGFTVTFVTAPTSSNYVVIGREVSLDQTDPYRTSKGFQGAVIEDSFDKITAIVQDNAEVISRSLKFQIGSTAEGSLPVPVDGEILAWDGTSGELKNGANITDIALAAPSAATAVAAAASASTSQAAAASSATAAAASAIAAAAFAKVFVAMGSSTGSANAQAVSVTPSNFTLTYGNVIIFSAGFSNTSGMTLNVEGTGIDPIEVQDNSGDVSLIGGEVIAGNDYMMFVNAESLLQLINPSILNNRQANTQASGDSTNLLCTTQFANPNSIITSSGSRQNPDGSIEKWGIASIASGSSGSSISFPVAFPNNCFYVDPTVIWPGSGTTAFPNLIMAPTASGFSVNCSDGNGFFSAQTISWKAFGN